MGYLGGGAMYVERDQSHLGSVLRIQSKIQGSLVYWKNKRKKDSKKKPRSSTVSASLGDVSPL